MKRINTFLFACAFAFVPVQAEDAPSLASKLFTHGEVCVTTGPFRYAQDLDAAYLLELKPDKMLSGFRSEAGLTPRDSKYGGWESDGVAGQFLGHYLSACALYYSYTHDKRYYDRISYMIDELAECQKANGNGYVAATPDGKRIFAEIASGTVYSQGFDLNGGWVPLYVMHKVLAGLIDVYEKMGNDKALEVAKGLGYFMYATFSGLDDEKMQAVLACEYGGMNEALANLYSITDEVKFLELAKRFDFHKVVMSPLAEKVDKLEGLHANTQVPKMVGCARMYELTGSERDSVIASFFWDTVVKNHTYVNGGNSDGEHFGAPGKLNDRLGTSTSETCNTYNMLKLTEHLFSWTNDERYAAYYEKAVYNHILATQNPEDGMGVYYTPLIQGGARGYLSKFNSFVCCSGSGVENHVKYSSFIYAEGADGSLYVNLFIPSKLDWKDAGLVVTQTTEIPSDSSAVFRIACKRGIKRTLRIRHPQWSNGMEIYVNGKRVAASSEGGRYVSMERKWKDGDVVEAKFHLAYRTESMPDNPNRVGIFYGPVLLAGTLGREEPNLEKDIPVLITDGRPVDEWLKKVSDYPLRFRTENVGEPYDMELRPFCRLHHQHYMVYWDLFRREDWNRAQEEYKAELRHIQELEKITVDYMALGEMQPERDHKLVGDGIGNGIFNRKKWRAAWTGGWFAFDMKVLPDMPMRLLVTYWGGETPEKEFTISVDGKTLVVQKIYMNNPGRFFEIAYDLPKEFTAGKESVKIRFDGTPTWTGAIYNARIVKAEK
ncbi:MAG: glycoside hydrolase family 127 protein [Prevotellaceae bacterium]|nr:glycoside hydrolase family 127 protein [Prevotellaceae bacterium]